MMVNHREEASKVFMVKMARVPSHGGGGVARLLARWNNTVRHRWHWMAWWPAAASSGGEAVAMAS